MRATCIITLWSSLLFGNNLTLVQAFSTKGVEKTALVTGATDGIGLTTAKELAKAGYRVIVHGRDPERIKKACQEVRKAGFGFKSAVPAMADLSSIEGCRALATATNTACLTQGTHLDLIVNNAGVFASDDNVRKVVGEKNLEETFAVNVLAPFIVTSLLLPLLTAKDGSRIIIVSSISQCSTIADSDWEDLQYEKRPFSNHKAYSESKLFDAMLTVEMANRLINSGIGTDRVTCNTLDPGTVNTKMLLAGWGPCGIEVESALNEFWLSTSDEVARETGQYYVGRRNRKAAGYVYDPNQRQRLWDILSELHPESASIWNKIGKES